MICSEFYQPDLACGSAPVHNLDLVAASSSTSTPGLELLERLIRATACLHGLTTATATTVFLIQLSQRKDQFNS